MKTIIKTQETLNEDSIELEGLVKKIAAIIGVASGNVLEEKQFPMVKNRLKKRMSTLDISSINDYENYFKQNKEKEIQELVGLLTTHHTFFFREFIHFEFILENLKSLVASVKARGENCVKVWSAASSRGQEVYSLALFLKYHLKQIDPSITFKIMGSDIDAKTVAIAVNAVYHEREIKEIPSMYLSDYVVKGKDDISNYYKFKKEITGHCNFTTFNLLQDNYQKLGKFDLILCRNVLIYFKEQDTIKVVNSMRTITHDNGFLITGLSESLVGKVTNLSNLGPSCYGFGSAVKTVNTSTSKMDSKTDFVNNTQQIETKKVSKVLCVDDSPSVLKILSMIFNHENGFELVGTAKNGLEAEAFLKNHKVDLMTLDIHMPEMDGVSYLRKNFRFGKHPPVLMISSVSREDDNLAQKALAFGASDFIEKPSLQDMELKASEIRTKAKVCIHRSVDKPQLSSFDNIIQKTRVITKIDKKLLIIQCSLIDRFKIMELLKEREKVDTPAIIMLTSEEGSDHKQLLMDHLSNSKTKFKFNDSLPNSGKPLNSNEIYFANHSDFISQFDNLKTKRDILFLIYGAVGTFLKNKISAFSQDVHLVIEELDDNKNYINYARDFVPSTTMPYMINQYFTRDTDEKVA